VTDWNLSELFKNNPDLAAQNQDADVQPHTRRMAATGPSEHDEQVALIQWADSVGGAVGLLFAIPNGGQRHPAVAAKLKAEGVRAGVPDLFLPVARGGYNGLFIEMKVGKNKPTDSQKEWMRALMRREYAFAICYGAEEAIDTIQEYMEA